MTLDPKNLTEVMITAPFEDDFGVKTGDAIFVFEKAIQFGESLLDLIEGENDVPSK